MTYRVKVKVIPLIPMHDMDHDDCVYFNKICLEAGRILPKDDVPLPESIRGWHFDIGVRLPENLSQTPVDPQKTIIEAALDAFHRAVPIACLDDFSITAEVIERIEHELPR